MMKLIQLFNSKYFLWICILYIVFFLIHILLIYNSTDSGFVYPIDDTYIHMGVAKNILNEATYSANNFEFSSSSSSIIWPFLLLICFSIFGMNIAIPLILNFVIGFLIVLFVFFVISRFANEEYGFIISFCSMLFIALFSNIFIGMENLLFGLISLCFVYLLYQYINKKSNFYLLIIVAFFLATVRFEALFFLPVLFVLWVYYKEFQFKDLLLLSLFIVFPIIVFCIIIWLNGSLFLPNSVILKGISGTGGFFGLLLSKAVHIRSHFGFASLYILSFIIFCLTSVFNKYLEKLMSSNNLKILHFFSLVSFLITTVHICFGRFGWLFRYEFYLILLLFFVFAFALYYFYNKIESKKVIFKLFMLFIIILIIMFPFSLFSLGSFFYIPLSSQNIEMTHIVKSEIINDCNFNNILVEDIGATSYFAEAELIDILGLGNNDIAKAKLIDDNNYLNYKFNSTDISFTGFDYSESYKNVLNWSVRAFFGVGSQKISLNIKEKLHFEGYCLNNSIKKLEESSAVIDLEVVTK
jgi:hypothetical protein